MKPLGILRAAAAIIALIALSALAYAVHYHETSTLLPNEAKAYKVMDINGCSNCVKANCDGTADFCNTQCTTNYPNGSALQTKCYAGCQQWYRTCVTDAQNRTCAQFCK
jgi:hypothetical protein